MPACTWYVAIALLAVLGLSPVLAACNTTGEDTAATDQAVPSPVKDAKAALRGARMRF
jgi:predicted small secreted protein